MDQPEKLTTAQIIDHMIACEEAMSEHKTVLESALLERLFVESKRQMKILEEMKPSEIKVFQESTLSGSSLQNSTATAILDSLKTYKSFLYAAMPKELRGLLEFKPERPGKR
jgi:hypothetical protein